MCSQWSRKVAALKLPEDVTLRAVVSHYVSPGDFNGLFVGRGVLPVDIDTAAEHVVGGLLQVVSENDYPNPHIRPWKSRRSIDDQVTDLRDAATGVSYGVCLYPKPQIMAEVLEAGDYVDLPYERRLAEGQGWLDVAYFRFEVLESYRNDPRYHFDFLDFGVTTGVTDAVYLAENERDADKVSLSHIGYAYDFSRADDGVIARSVCAFLSDLAKLTPEHQWRWRSYEVTPPESVHPHPVWFGQMMGNWADGIGPFEKLMVELKAWNTLHMRAFDCDLLRETERPREFGWIIRSSQSEFDQFVQTLDKLLSDNISHEALDAANAPRKNEAGDSLGTLNRIAQLLESKGNPKESVDELLLPLREVRSARMEPAHRLRRNVTDENIVGQQVELLVRVIDSVQDLRQFWQRHPANADWADTDVEEKHYRL